MVRSISANAQSKLDQDYGTEPIVIVEVQWVDGGSIYTYADKDLGGTEGRILEVSGLDNTVVIQGVRAGYSGDSQQISVTVDDTGGQIKDIIDQNDIHKQPCWVYQYFEGLDQSDKFLIFKGQVSSPMQWNEGDRTISFDIITRIEDAEVGFSMEEGNFEYTPEDLVGEPWPLIFGTVENSPCLRTRSLAVGVLATGVGIADYMLPPKEEQAGKVCCPWIFSGFSARYINSNSWGAGSLEIRPIYEKDINCTCKVKATQCELSLNYANQIAYEYSQIDIVNGSRFPQGQQLGLNIGGGKFYGYFAGDTFHITNRIHPERAENPVPEIKYFGCDPAPTGYENQYSEENREAVCILPDDCGGWGSTIFSHNRMQYISGTKEQAAWDYLSSFKEAGFFWADPGTEVTLIGDDEIVYIANILPSTVHYVKAYRTFKVSGIRQFTTVPRTYYTVRHSDFNGYTVCEIVMTHPLSSLGDGWEDDIYVTLTSSVGPNTVDEMEWLIDKYTEFDVNTTNFDAIRDSLENYPMNFRVPGRKNILTLLQEMAFQARCALVLRNDEFFLTYLSEEPNEDGNIAEDDVLANSLILDHTDTEDLVTKFVAKWKPSLELEDDYKVILRYNVKRYGTQEEAFDFYCYNIQELVVKSATFWLIRMANTWRKIQCKTPINKLNLETLDGVYVTLPQIANGEIKCRVETATYNSDDHAIDFVLQTPVRSGSKDAFPFHYPADIEISELHPIVEDLRQGNAGGSGPNVDVEAPDGHVLGTQKQKGFSGFSFGQASPCESLSGDTTFYRPIDAQGKCRSDQGDQQPSDKDDTKPIKQVKQDTTTVPPGQSNVKEISEAKEIINEFVTQQEGSNQDQNAKISDAVNAGTGSEQGAGAHGGAGSINDSGGTSSNNTDLKKELKKKPKEDELDEKNQCYWALRVYYFNPVSTVRIKNGETCVQGTPPELVVCNSSLGWCYCSEQGKSGCVVGNQVLKDYEDFLFDSPQERDAAWKSIEEIIGGTGVVGETFPGFTQRWDNAPVGCTGQAVTDDQRQGIIGYDQSGESSIFDVNGFGTDNFVPVSPCDY